jgi:hypothetical protein
MLFAAFETMYSVLVAGTYPPAIEYPSGEILAPKVSVSSVPILIFASLSPGSFSKINQAIV